MMTNKEFRAKVAEVMEVAFKEGYRTGIARATGETPELNTFEENVDFIQSVTGKQCDKMRYEEEPS